MTFREQQKHERGTTETRTGHRRDSNRKETLGEKPYDLCDSIDTYLLTPWCRVLLEKLTGLQLVKKLPAFHGTRRLITALTSVRHLSLPWASPIHSIYPPPQWSPSHRFPHQDPIRPPLLNHTRHMPSPSHSSRFYHPHNIG